MNDDQQPFPVSDYPDAPLANRFTRSTLSGCLGIAGVLALPLMLLLPLETWGIPRWAFLLVQLLAFSALGGGIGLLSRVPSAVRGPSHDPLHPLTARGAAPMLERPARWQNRGGVGAVWGLLALALIGYLVASFIDAGRTAIAAGMLLASLAGLALAAYGLSIALGRLEPPALRWVRMPATVSWLPQGGSLMLMGLVLLGWALFVAAEVRFAWGAIGLVLLLLATALIAPAFRRLPGRGP